MSTTPPVSDGAHTGPGGRRAGDPRPGRTPDGTAFRRHGPDPEPGEAVVVLIHGLGLAQDLWDTSLGFFADRPTITYDLVGHGESASVTRGDAPLTLADLAAQVVAVLDEVGAERAHLVGFSIGGMINRRVVLDAPDRVASIAVLNSPHDRGPEAQVAVEERAAAVRTGDPLATLDAAIRRWFTPGFIEARPDVIGDVTRWRHGVDPLGYADAAWILANGVVELTDPSLRFDVPSFVMTSANDTGSTPAMAAAIARQLDDCDCVIVPDRQHLGLLEDPAAFCGPVIDFLDSLDAGRTSDSEDHS